MKDEQTQSQEAVRLAILGVGQGLNGDDGVGLAVVRALHPLVDGREDILLIEAGPAPENFTGVLRRFAPDVVLLVDAAQMNEPPGTLHWLDAQAATGFSASSHTLPLSVLGSYLEGEMGCRVEVLAIQVKDTRLGVGLSAEVEGAIAGAVEAIANRFLTSDV